MRARSHLTHILQNIVRDMGLPWPERAAVEAPRDPAHGDLASNAAMLLGREAGTNPRELAQRMAQALRDSGPDIASAEVAGPGFLNIRFSPGFWQACILDIARQGTCYGASNVGQGKKTQVEYVSANPTGPLHIGHGRGAAVGDALARILRFAGYDVQTEYYINDAGKQMRLLGLSIWLRAREGAALPVEWPEEYYRGAYIADLAAELVRRRPDLLSLPENEAVRVCQGYGADEILDGIKADLREFRVEHQAWFSERSLIEGGAVERAFAHLQEKGFSFERDGALWFATTRLGDDQDRVLRKSDGSLTYFASDIAYHHDKYQRGFVFVIDIWGADHHGYAPRMRAAVQALGRKPEEFEVLLIQLVNLLEKGVPVSMSTRAGTFETLADVVREVGVDAARFSFLMRKCDSPLDFDLELARQRSMDNPVYYVQYAHARIRALLRRAEERGQRLPEELDAALLAPLATPEDIALLRLADHFAEVAVSAALKLAPHHVGNYLMELAGHLHRYYAKHPVLQADDPAGVPARLALLRAVGQVLTNGLELLGVSAPEAM
ncbi:MAG: arginine--tRNA ligase [Deltaproteobacteria bacterium]|jgi:arginyl-tRNA synthetase|nr:arginine--tRNA ligase [Deltaproteobacteria bacterium]